MAYTKGDYDRHYCCFRTDKFGLPRCSERDPDHPSNAAHGHCRRCGKRTREAKGFLNADGAGLYRECYDCYQSRTEAAEIPSESQSTDDEMHFIL